MNPLALRHLRGCRGAERPTPASPEAKALKRVAPVPSKSKSLAPSETKLPSNPSPGERERVITLSHPVPRGDVGERSAPRSRRRERKTSREQFPHRRKRMPSKEQPCIVGNQTPRRTSPGRAREGRNPLAPVTRGGVGEQSAPRPCRRKQRPQKNSLLRRKPKSPSEQPRESARGCEPSRLPIEADDLRGGKVSCPKGKQESLCDRPSEIEDFGWSPRVLIFSERGLAPPEKKSLPCRSRARKSAGFQRNLRKGGVEGNPSPPPPGELERAAALSNFQSRGFPQEIVSASRRGWQWRGSLLPRPPHARSSAVIKFPNDST